MKSKVSKTASSVEPEEPKSDIDLITSEASTESEALQTQVSSLVIVSKADYDNAGVIRQRAKSMIDRIKERFKGTAEKPGPKTLAWNAHKAICELENDLIKPFEEMDQTAEAGRKQWRVAEEQRQIEERRKLDEQIRLDAERRLKEEADRKIAEAEAEYSAKFQKASELYKQGKTAEADGLLEIIAEELIPDEEENPEPEIYVSPLPVFTPQNLKTDGIGVRKIAKFRIIDEQKIKREFLVADEKLIAAKLKSLKGREKDLEKIVGEGSIEVYFDDAERVSRSKGEF